MIQESGRVVGRARAPTAGALPVSVARKAEREDTLVHASIEKPWCCRRETRRQAPNQHCYIGDRDTGMHLRIAQAN